MSDHVSANFSWAEVIGSPTARARHIDNALPQELIPNAHRVATGMEEVRLLLGGPIHVNSWYRCPELNAAIGGSKTSAHMKALAVDFRPTTIALLGAFELIAATESIVFDQLIHERTADGADWIHFGLSTGVQRRQVLRASGQHLGGTMQFERVAAG